MPSTASPLLRLELQTTGENLNAWGSKLNDLFTATEQAIASVYTITITGDKILTADNYAPNEYRRAALILTGSPAADFTLTVPSVSYLYRIINRTGKQATLKTATGAGAVVRVGTTATVPCDGTDCTISDPTLDKIRPATSPIDLNSQELKNAAPATADTSVPNRAQVVGLVQPFSDSASASAAGASNSAASASGSATSAANSATSASQSATSAANSATASANSAVQAANAAAQAGGGFPRSTRTAAQQFVAGDKVKWITLNFTGTQPFDTPANLGAGWTLIVEAGGTITVPASDGITNWKMYTGEIRYFSSDGSMLTSHLLQGGLAIFTASDNFIWGPGLSWADADIISGGAAGGTSGPNTGGSYIGGSGGSRWRGRVGLKAPGTTEAIIVGAGGVASTTPGGGPAGGASSFSGISVPTITGFASSGSAAGTNAVFGAGGGGVGGLSGNSQGAIPGPGGASGPIAGGAGGSPGQSGSPGFGAFLGSGGGGGTGSTGPGTPGNGGNGGIPGGGGGGGGSTTTAGGIGGNGGRGEVRITYG